MHPDLSSTGKYPWLVQRFKINERGSLISDFISLRSTVETLWILLLFLRFPITDSISLLIIGLMKNVLRDRFERKDDTSISTDLTLLITLCGILIKYSINLFGKSSL